MEIIRTIAEMQNISSELILQGKKIVCVPTMGYFHQGHISLMKKAREYGDIVITTLFVNPTQFAPNEDFNSYPRDYDGDSKMAQAAGVDYLFFPTVSEMYPTGYDCKIHIGGITSKFEGATRPTHFDGVATVVTKLFNITKPHFAIFGQKDYQQVLVIRKLVQDLNLDVKIIVAPILRENDGLAMSSRNTYLMADLRKKAGILFQALEDARMSIENGERKRKMINAILHKNLRSVPEIKIDYACSVDADTLEEPDEFRPGDRIVLLLAVFLGKTRLIDNATITIPSIFPSLGKDFKEGI
jgi:pantoate--beta-alanine ligase